MIIPPEFLQKKNLLLHPEPFLWLVEVRNPDDGPLKDPSGASKILRLTPNEEPISFGTNPNDGTPLVWSPWKIRFGDIKQDSEGNVNTIPVSVSNVLGATMRLFRDNDFLRDHIAYLHLVHFAFLDNPSAKWTIRSTIVESSATYESASFDLAAFNLMNFDVPQRLVLRTCGHTYRDPDCGFIGDVGNVILGDCILTYGACELRGAQEVVEGLPVNHPNNFGGAHALPVGPISVG